MNPPTDIYNAVSPYANQYGVPDRIWEDIAWNESGYNPNIIGDNGISIGLFQLNTAGGQGTGYSTSSLEDPSTNASIAMPYIGNAYNSLKGSFDDSINWWIQFAIQSGHPGGTTQDPATLSLATKLKNTYDSSSNTTPLISYGSGRSNEGSGRSNEGQVNSILQTSFAYLSGVGLIVTALLIMFSDNIAKGVGKVVKIANRV